MNTKSLLTFIETKRKTPPSNKQKDDAFTLLELMITVVVISILVAIVSIVAADQQRQAIIATVRHDVGANKAVMSPGAGTKIYVTPEKFNASAAQTDKNVAYYTVTPDGSESCTHTVRKFSEGDEVVWRLWTKIGRQEPLYCPDLGGGSVTTNPGGGVGGETIVTTPTPTPTPTTTGNPNNNDGGYGTDPIRPNNSVTRIEVIMTSNETYRVCYNVRVTTVVQAGAPWSVYIDKTVAPFSDGNFIEGLNDSRYHMTDNGTHYVLYGSAQMEVASATKVISPSFCTKAPNNLPVIPKATRSLPVTIGSVDGNQYYATQNFTVGNSSQYYTGWEVEVDLTDLINRVSGKPNNKPFVDTDVSIMSLEHVSGNIYKVKSVISYRAIKTSNNYTFTIRLG